jgi:hypothetical protein
MVAKVSSEHGCYKRRCQVWFSAPDARDKHHDRARPLPLLGAHDITGCCIARALHQSLSTDGTCAPEERLMAEVTG